ncbi:hypothetical protein PRIPAC_75024, partial [Pristionchus pacificus]
DRFLLSFLLKMSHQIVYFDKNNKRQGPFTERQVQDWYRTGWFDRGIKFSFLSPQLEQLDDHTPAYSLDELIRHKGHGCPFIGPPISSVDQKEKRMDRLEKEMAEVRGVCDSILALSVRVDMIEQRIKELIETPPPVEPTTEESPRQEMIEKRIEGLAETPALVEPASKESPNHKIERKDLVDTPPASRIEPTTKEVLKQAIIEKRIKIKKLTETPPPSPVQPTTKKEPAGVPKRIREECEELAGRVAASSMRAIDLLQSSDFGGWDDKRALKLVAQVEIFLNEHDGNEKALQLASKLTVQELLKRLEGRDYVHCSPCGAFLHNARQTLVHCVSPDHVQKVTKFDSGRMLAPMLALSNLATHIFKWGDEDWAKQLSQKGDVSNVVPTREFLLNLQFKHGLPISHGVVIEMQQSGIDPTKMDLPALFQRQMPAYLRKLKGPQGAAVIAELDAHIGSGITGCIDCGVVTRTNEAYYEHVLTWAHKASVVNNFALNVHSIAINCHMKHLLKTDI